jgi:hypothetical protein
LFEELTDLVRIGLLGMGKVKAAESRPLTDRFQGKSEAV